MSDQPGLPDQPILARQNERNGQPDIGAMLSTSTEDGPAEVGPADTRQRR